MVVKVLRGHLWDLHIRTGKKGFWTYGVVVFWLADIPIVVRSLNSVQFSF